MSSNLVYVGYCFVCVLIYLAIAVSHHLQHKPWDYHVVADIAVATCFVIYLAGYQWTAWTVGITATVVQMILDIHFSNPKNHKKLDAKRAEIIKRRSQKNEKKSNRQKIISGDDISHD